MNRSLSCLAGPIVVGVLVAAAGCSSGSAAPPAAGTHTPKFPTVPPVSPCPSPTGTGATFPDSAASRVPHPPIATAPKLLPVSVEGVTLLQFTTPMALRDAVAYVLKAYPAAGYTIHGGDSEGHEADVPFASNGLTGKTRLTGVSACSTTWLVATSTRSGANLDDVPHLSPHHEPPDTDSAG